MCPQQVEADDPGFFRLRRRVKLCLKKLLLANPRMKSNESSCDRWQTFSTVYICHHLRGTLPPSISKNSWELLFARCLETDILRSVATRLLLWPSTNEISSASEQNRVKPFTIDRVRFWLHNAALFSRDHADLKDLAAYT